MAAVWQVLFMERSGWFFSVLPKQLVNGSCELQATFCNYKKLAISETKTVCHHKFLLDALNFI